MFLEIQRPQIIAPLTGNKCDVCAAVCCNEPTPFASQSTRKTRAHYLYRSSDGDHGIGYFVRCIGAARGGRSRPNLNANSPSTAGVWAGAIKILAGLSFT